MGQLYIITNCLISFSNHTFPIYTYVLVFGYPPVQDKAENSQEEDFDDDWDFPTPKEPTNDANKDGTSQKHEPQGLIVA